MKKLEITESNLKKLIKESIDKVLINEQVGDKLSSLAAIVQKYNEAIQYVKTEQKYMKAANLYKISLMRNRNQVARVYNAIVFQMNGVPEAKQYDVTGKTIINNGWVQNTQGKHFLYFLTKLFKFKGVSPKAMRAANSLMTTRTVSYISRQLSLKNGQLISQDMASNIQNILANIKEREAQKIQAKDDRKQARVDRRQQRLDNKQMDNSQMV